MLSLSVSHPFWCSNKDVRFVGSSPKHVLAAKVLWLSGAFSLSKNCNFCETLHTLCILMHFIKADNALSSPMCITALTSHARLTLLAHFKISCFTNCIVSVNSRYWEIMAVWESFASMVNNRLRQVISDSCHTLDDTADRWGDTYSHRTCRHDPINIHIKYTLFHICEVPSICHLTVPSHIMPVAQLLSQCK